MYSGRAILIGAAALLVLHAAAQAAAARAPRAKFTIVQQFNARTEGNQPTAGLSIDSAGTLYGATELGGRPEDFGTLFAIPTGGKEQVLYLFGANLVEPNTTPALDSAGNLYGTALFDTTGTGDEWGGVYKVDSAGNETVLYDFTGKQDGGTSNSNLLIDGAGNLYGTTEQGGNLGQQCDFAGCGVIYRIDASGTYTVLHTFAWSDGDQPEAGLIMDAKGNLYGTTAFGGASGSGTVFRLDPKGDLTVLYNFTGYGDGDEPWAGVVLDAQGNLYGTTQYGGGSCNYPGCGVVFKVTPKGKETVLHSFGPRADGYAPVAGLTVSANGTLYGTTQFGGKNNDGVVFSLRADGSLYRLVHQFSDKRDGSQPSAGLAVNAEGDLFGTAQYGGHGSGTVFEIQP